MVGIRRKEVIDAWLKYSFKILNANFIYSDAFSP